MHDLALDLSWVALAIAVLLAWSPRERYRASQHRRAVTRDVDDFAAWRDALGRTVGR